MKDIRIYLIDNEMHAINKQIKLLSNFNDIKVVGSALSAEEAIKQIARLEIIPHVVISELWILKLNAFELTRFLKKRFSQLEVIIHTVFAEKNYVISAIQAGVSGYLLKGSLVQKMHLAIHEVCKGGLVIESSILRNLLEHLNKNQDFDETPPYSLEQKLTLSVREIQCLITISKGLNNQEAASSLKISLATMKTHLEHIYQKLEVKNRTEAVTKAIKKGIINT